MTSRPESARAGRPATMSDVAARARVSRALVSIVFRDQPGASQATRERVRQAARELGYAPDQRARLLSRRRSGLLGVQFAVEHPFHGELVEALYTAAEARGYELALSAVAPSRDEERAVASLLAYRCEALILLGPTAPDGRLDALGQQVPLVVVARNLRTEQAEVVRTDDEDGARQATQHLLALGHTRIVQVDGGGAPGSAERRRGYRAAMERAGLATQVRVLTGGPTERDGLDAFVRLAAEPADPQGPRRPSAVVAFNDRCALGVLQAATQAGLQVPTDLSVVGYDDSRMATLPWVDLTTVRQDVAELATLAVARAVARIEGPPGAASLLTPPRLVVRGSTGPVPRPA
ncbi:MAG: LacI family transcriptional regulator [Friedmanniella sp.]|nr:LacI family transcriptional regulator [Friedmanniella sp.]